MMLTMGQFMGKRLREVAKEQPDVCPTKRFKAVMQVEWPAWKASLPAAVVNPPPVAPAPAPPDPLKPVLAQRCGPSPALAGGARVLGLLCATPTPLPPPAFMPLNQRRKNERKLRPAVQKARKATRKAAHAKEQPATDTCGSKHSRKRPVGVA